MVISSKSTSVRDVAREALQTLEDGRTDYAARCDADRYLGRIEREGDALESLVARTAGNAAGQRMKNESSITAQKIALQAVASGLTGAPSRVLARFAFDVLSNVEDVGNARQMGYTLLKAIIDNSDDSHEKVLTQVVYDVSGQMLTHASGLQAQRAGLQILVGGLKTDGTELPACGVPRYGTAAVSGAATPDDACTIAAAVLFKLSDGAQLRASEMALVKTVGLAAEVCEDRDDAAEVLKDGLKMVDAGGLEGVEAKLARFGLVARSHAAFVDSRKMGRVVLEQIEENTSDPRIREKAHKGATRSEPGAQSWWDRVRGVEPEGRIAAMQRSVLNDIATCTPRMDKEAEQQAMEEIEKLAGIEDKPKEKTIQVEDDTVIIGGVRIRKHAPADPAAAAATPPAR